ncbi:uncharacterized protein LOC135948659 [Calliphora vicina]|uniref:uncharacterized protein LOC135948659 n=1 Tax=Calliphora vicina TaxID=7373 RepID=UPI00325C1658
MDAFKVPKKVNRHVLKAIDFLSGGKADRDVPTSKILDQVKYQMRNLVPVPNINMVIQKSLKNLSDIGLIDRTAPERFAIGHSAPKANKAKTVNRNIFKPSGSRKRSNSQLNPNIKRFHFESEESLPGDEYDRSRKRMRTNNKKVNYSGHSTELPKARQHFRFKNIALADPLASPSPLYMRDNESDYDIDQTLEMAVFIGPTMNSNTDLNLSNISPTKPLEITEIPWEDQANDFKQTPNKSTQSSYDSVETAGTNSNTFTNSQSKDQLSKTRVVDSNVSRNEKSKTSQLQN